MSGRPQWGPGAPAHLLHVVGMGHECDLGYHHAGCNLSEGVCVPMGEELYGGLCE